MRTASYYPSPSIRSRSLLEQLITSAIIGVGVFLAGFLMITLVFQIWFAGRIFPGVSIAGVPIGGLSPQQAAIKITTDIQYPQNGQILFQDHDKSWIATPAELGLFLDPDASAKAAYSLGRNSNIFANLIQQFGSLYYGRTMSPVMIYDQRATSMFLENIAAQTDLPAVEASIQLNGTDVIVKPGETGRVLDKYTAMATIGIYIQNLQNAVIPLKIDEVKPAILDASQQADIARKILSQPLVISLPNGLTDKGPWQIEPSELAPMLAFDKEQKDGAAYYQVGLNRDQLLIYLTKLAPDVKLYPQNARFIFNDETRKLDLIEPAIIGRTLDVPASIDAINSKIIKNDHTISLEFTFTNPAITDDATAEKLQIKELVGMQTSYFRGSSPERVQNIKTAASRFHGVLVAPGETFSMADQLGDISLDNGYAEAMIIFGDQTIKGVGGGVCQVSTTLFRTVFFAGYPVVERHPHAYRVYYYEQIAGGYNPNFAGLDATVFVPLVDFKFTNDTTYWLLMEVYVEPQNSSITWKFYSTSDGRSVEWNSSGPQNIVKPPTPQVKENSKLDKNEIKQVDWAAEGADITVNRQVYRNGDLYFQDQFATHYDAWQAKYEYGPGTDKKLLDELKK